MNQDSNMAGGESEPMIGAPPGNDFEAAQQAIFEAHDRSFDSRYVDVPEPSLRIHVLHDDDSDSDEVPLLMLHGGGSFGASFAPLMPHLPERRLIVIDRPGYGLSGDFVYSAESYRETAINVFDAVLDDLAIDQVDIIGNSGGGYWGIVAARARPERVRRMVAIGSVPTFPGTHPPFPLRLFSLPVVPKIIAKLQEPSPEAVIKQYGMFGEGDTIQNYPALIDAIVAQQRRSRSTKVDSSEFKSLLTLRGWRRHTRLQPAELNDLQQPTLFVWGDLDPLGGPDDVRATIDLLPNGRIESVHNVGHLPWLGAAKQCADLIVDFLGAPGTIEG